jgi:hypothetical protein
MTVQLKVLQLNCGKNGEILMAIMESRLQLGADLVIVQEAPNVHGWRHPGFHFFWVDGGRVMTGVHKDTKWKMKLRPDLN